MVSAFKQEVLSSLSRPTWEILTCSFKKRTVSGRRRLWQETCDIQLIIPNVSSMNCYLWHDECVACVVLYVPPLFVRFVVGYMSYGYSTHRDAQAKLKLLAE